MRVMHHDNASCHNMLSRDYCMQAGPCLPSTWHVSIRGVKLTHCTCVCHMPRLAVQHSQCIQQADVPAFATL